MTEASSEPMTIGIPMINANGDEDPTSRPRLIEFCTKSDNSRPIVAPMPKLTYVAFVRNVFINLRVPKNCLNVITIRIENECGEIVLVILRSRTGCSVVFAASS